MFCFYEDRILGRWPDCIVHRTLNQFLLTSILILYSTYMFIHSALNLLIYDFPVLVMAHRFSVTVQ